MRSWSASTAIFDWTETHTGLKATRNAAIRQALSAWLAERERRCGLLPPGAPAPPKQPMEPQHFYEAYQALGSGRDFVRIHRLREALGWPREVFDRVLETLSAQYDVELHGGDPGRLSAEELDGAYRDAHGTLYLTVSWRGA
jgi:hypothetical protein